jgi:hypothetical protein
LPYAMLVPVVNPDGKLPPAVQLVPLVLTAVANVDPVDIATNLPLPYATAE